MPAEAILGLRWIERASLYFDLTDQAVGVLVEVVEPQATTSGPPPRTPGPGCRRRNRGPVAEAPEPRTIPIISSKLTALRGLQA